MASRVTLAGILEGCSVSEEQLKIVCTPELFLIVAEKLTSWEPLANSLGLSEEHLRDIQRFYPRNHTLVTLTTWEETVGVAATLLELAKALERIGHLELAEELVRFKLADRQTAVDQKVKMFEKRFEDLAKDTLRELTDDDVSFNTTLFPSTIRDDHLKYVNLKDKKHLKEIFLHFNVYWDFFHYTLLEMIVEEHGSTDLKVKMEIYVSDLITFLNETNVTEYIPKSKLWWRKNRKFRIWLKNATTQSSINHPCTLFTLKEHKDTISNRNATTEQILILKTIEPHPGKSHHNSLTVTWFILCDIPQRNLRRSVNTLVRTLIGVSTFPLTSHNDNNTTPLLCTAQRPGKWPRYQSDHPVCLWVTARCARHCHLLPK